MSEPTDAMFQEEGPGTRAGAPMSLGEAASRFFGFPTPRLILTYFFLAAALRVGLGGAVGWGDAALVGAVALYWPFQEWFLHRYVLHRKPFRLGGRTVDLPVSRKHREHHLRPWFLPLVFLPVRPLLGVMVLNTAFWLLVMPRLGLAFTGMAAMAVAALLYEWTHYLTHTPYRPRSRFYAQVCLSHRRHHFKNEHYWYGFTLPLVDQVLGTGPDHRSVETSPTCRTLGVEPEVSDAP